LSDNIEVSDDKTGSRFSSLATQKEMCILFIEIAWIGLSNWVSKLKMKILFHMF